MMADKSIEYHDLLSGFVRVHILHHAAEREIYGQWIIDELARHGYRLSPGTVYPMLRAMEARGYLKSREEAQGGAGRPRQNLCRDENRAQGARHGSGAIARTHGRSRRRSRLTSEIYAWVF